MSSPAYTKEGEDQPNFSDYSRIDNNLFALGIKIQLVIWFKYIAYIYSILIGISAKKWERGSSPAYTSEGEDHINFSDYSSLDNNLSPLTQEKNTVGNLI